MTEQQWVECKNLIEAIRRIVRNAEQAYIPYELGAAIAAADDQQGVMYMVLGDRPAVPQPAEPK